MAHSWGRWPAKMDELSVNSSKYEAVSKRRLEGSDVERSLEKDVK